MPKWQDENGIPCDPRNGYDAQAIVWEELDALPTLSEGQADDCKIDNGRQRVWLSRCTTLDGEHCDHHITVETYNGDRWVTTSEN